MKNFLSNLCHDFKEIWVDKTDTPLQAMLHRSCVVDFVYCSIVSFAVIPVMWFFGMKGTSAYQFVEQFGLVLLVFAIADYCTYRKVKNFKEPEKQTETK